MGKNYTTREVAEMLHIYVEEVSRLIRKGELKASKGTGKWSISERDFEIFLEGHSGYKAVYTLHKKRVELANLKDDNPKEYYKYKIKQAMEEIENMQRTLDRHYRKLQRLLNEEELA